MQFDRGYISPYMATDADKMEALRIKCEDYYAQRTAYEWGSTYVADKVPIYLDPKSRDKLRECLTSVECNKQIQSLLKPEGLFAEPVIANEAALLMSVLVEHGGKNKVLKLKAKLDNFTYSVAAISTVNILLGNFSLSVNFETSINELEEVGGR